MDNYKLFKHYENDGQRVEDVLLDYFRVYLDMKSGSYDE